MTALRLRAFPILAFAAMALASVAAEAGPPLKHPPIEPHKIEPGQAPAQIGWPHTILSANTQGCNRDPGANEVIVFHDASFGGACGAMVAGFYPYGSNLGVGNDAIRSIKVGSAVRARVFLDAGYAGQWTAYGAGSVVAGLGSFDRKISSMRIEPANRADTCSDLREGEIALFEGYSGQGDCVVLPGMGSYPTADAMGIANDSISSVHNNSGMRFMGYWDMNYGRAGQEVKPHTNIDSLAQSYSEYIIVHVDGINDNISSMQMLPP